MTNHQSRSQNFRVLTLACCALLATACGGGSSSPNVAGIDAGGISPHIASSAAVTAFGSVVSGGVTWSTDGAAIFIDGSPALESGLAIGQQVRIVGDNDSVARATRIEVEHAVIGPIDSIDLATRDLVILGQAARTDASTSFAGAFSPGSLEGLAEGQIVAASGIRTADGRLFVTRIAPSSAADYRVAGTAGTVDPSAGTIVLNGLVVDYSQAMVTGFPGGEPATGDTVRVTGTRASTGDPLVASIIEFAPDESIGAAAGTEAARVIVDGFVTRFSTNADFDVDGIAVTTSAQTQYANGTVMDIGLDARLRADGTRSASGTFTADSIEFRVPGTFRIEAQLAAVDAAANELTVAGATIFVDGDTRLDDLSAAATRPFGIGDLLVGDQIEVRGYAVPGGIRATAIEREDDEGDAEIEISGFVTAVAEPSFEIAGIVIETVGATEFDDIDRSEFFAQGVGWRVEVEGDATSGTIVAEEVERDEVNDGDVDED